MRVDGCGSHELTSFVLLLAAAAVNTADVERFWQEYGKDRTPERVQAAYFAHASETWRQHLLNSGHPEYFRVALRSYERFYASVKPGTLQVAAKAAEIEAALAELRRRYPSPPLPVTMGIGRVNSAGQGYGCQVYLAAEMFALGQGIDTTELPSWIVGLMAPPQAVVPAAVHEAIHVFQPPVNDPVLLVACLREGAASFVAELVTGQPLQPQLEAWCRPRQSELFREFGPRAGSTAYSGWLYDSADPRQAGRPADTGYWIGHEIVRDFYSLANDKKAALRDIIDMHDPRLLVRRSSYRWILQPPRHQRRSGGRKTARSR